MHAVEPGRPADSQRGRGSAPRAKPGAVLRLMRELDVLAGAREHQSVLADDVAAAQHAEADAPARRGPVLPCRA